MQRQPSAPTVVDTPAGPGHVRFVIGEGTYPTPHGPPMQHPGSGWWAMIDPGAVPAGPPLAR